MSCQRSHFLSLPPEILLEIFKHLDYRALIDARQTCWTLFEMTNSEQFWASLARNLCSKPGIGELTYPLGNYSVVELMHWALRRLRARDRWTSGDPSRPLRFRSRLVEGGFALYGAVLLRGGRWLFIVQRGGFAHILDLERESPQPQALFDTYRSKEDPLVNFRIWIDETKRELSFRVATYSWITDSKKKTRICIHQIDNEGSSFVTTPITVFQDYPRASTRTGTALSDTFFLQSFALHDVSEDLVAPSLDIVLQLRQYSQVLNYNTQGFVETRVKVESIGPNSVFFLPGGRAGFVAPNFINIYAIGSDKDSAPLELVLLHHVSLFLSAHFLSTPFVGSRCTYLIGTYKDTLERITIDHDHNSTPTVQDLGNMEPPLRRVPSTVRFGPSASVVYRPRTSLDLITYEYRVDRACFLLKQHKIPDNPSLAPRCLAGFDDSTGRIVFETNTDGSQLLVLDLI